MEQPLSNSTKSVQWHRKGIKIWITCEHLKQCSRQQCVCTVAPSPNVLTRSRAVSHLSFLSEWHVVKWEVASVCWQQRDSQLQPTGRAAVPQERHFLAVRALKSPENNYSRLPGLTPSCLDSETVEMTFWHFPIIQPTNTNAQLLAGLPDVCPTLST